MNWLTNVRPKIRSILRRPVADENAAGAGRSETRTGDQDSGTG
jgi:hypothetical protein